MSNMLTWREFQSGYYDGFNGNSTVSFALIIFSPDGYFHLTLKPFVAECICLNGYVIASSLNDAKHFADFAFDMFLSKAKLQPGGENEQSSGSTGSKAKSSKE